jgi:hypothetical protein
MVDGLAGPAEPFWFVSVAHLFKKQFPLRRVEQDQALTFLRLLVMIRSGDRVLTLATTDRSDLPSGRSIGMLGYVKAKDHDLFSNEPVGVNAATRRTIIEQSNFPRNRVDEITQNVPFDKLRCTRAYTVNDSKQDNSIVVVTHYECSDPDEFISLVPASRQPRWTRVPSEINDVSCLEPVSRHLLAVGVS